MLRHLRRRSPHLAESCLPLDHSLSLSPVSLSFDPFPWSSGVVPSIGERYSVVRSLVRSFAIFSLISNLINPLAEYELNETRYDRKKMIFIIRFNVQRKLDDDHLCTFVIPSL